MARSSRAALTSDVRGNGPCPAYELYRYRKGFMQQKVTVIDDDCCTIGTANFAGAVASTE